MSVESLDEPAWRDLASFWKKLAHVPHLPFDSSLQKTVEALRILMGGSHVLLVIQMRVHHDEVGDAFHPVVSRDIGPDAEARLAITREWATHEPLLHEDPILRQIIDGAGEPRVVRHRAHTTDSEWQTAPVRRLMKQLRLHDRVNVIVPVAEGVEVSFCIDRAEGERAFDDRDHEILERVLEGLRPLANNLVCFHGLMPGQQRLTDTERELVIRLLSPHSEEVVARAMGVDLEALRASSAQTFRKLNVKSRVELMHLWRPTLDGAIVAGGSSDTDLDAAASEADPLIARLRGAIDRALGQPDLNIETIAQDLGMGVRKLQRDLTRHDTSFSDLCDQRREHLAMILLALPWVSFQQVSERLGFSQVSSFNRAVARWTGQTPSETRESLLEEHRIRRDLSEGEDNGVSGEENGT